MVTKSRTVIVFSIVGLLIATALFLLQSALEVASPNILILGDSLTNGAGAIDRNGWAQQILANFPDLKVTISADGGSTIFDVLERVSEYNRDEFTHIILAVGIVDSRYRPSLNRREISLSEFEAGLRQFESLFSSETQNIYLIGLTRVDESKTTRPKKDKHFFNADIELYDQVLKDIAAEYDLTYIRVPPLNDQEGLLYDGLHPSDAGYALMYQSIIEQLPFLRQ